MEDSPTGATGTAWERTPWHATAGGVGGPYAIPMTAIEWIGLAFLVLFVASWMFIEYVTFKGIESAFRRLRSGGAVTLSKIVEGGCTSRGPLGTN